MSRIRDKGNFSSVGNRLLTDATKLNNAEFAQLQNKLADDERRINMMKKQRAYDSSLQPDLEEIMNSGPADNFVTQAKYIYDGTKISNQPQEKLEALTKLRLQLEDYNFKKLNGQKIDFVLPIKEAEYQGPQKQDKMNSRHLKMNDFDQLRRDYIEAGGKDPNFLLNLSNLETTFTNKSQNPNYSLNPNQSMLNMSQRPITNTFLGRGQQIISAPYIKPPQNYPPSVNRTNVSYSENIGAFQNQHTSHQTYAPPPQQFNSQPLSGGLTSHPIFDYLPQSFQHDLVNLEQENHNLKHNPSIPLDKLREASGMPKRPEKVGGESDEKMLEYLRFEETELLLIMSRMDQRTQQYQSSLQKFQEVQRLKGVVEKSILDKKVLNAVQDTQSKQGRENKLALAANSSSYHQLQSNMNRMPVYYSETEGFIVHWDYVTSLSIMYKSIRIAFGLFRKGVDMYAYRFSTDHTCSFESFRSNKCMILEREIIRDQTAFPDLFIFIEIWGFLEENGKPEVIGWTLLNLFDAECKLLIGRFRIPLYNKSFNPNLLFQQPLPYQGSHKLYLRICLHGDTVLDTEDNILIENEYHVPDIHIHTSAHTVELNSLENVYPGEKTQSRGTSKKIGSRSGSRSKGTTIKDESTPGERTAQNKIQTPIHGYVEPKDPRLIIFRLFRLRNIQTKQFSQLKLKVHDHHQDQLGIFIGNKIHYDPNQQPQMAQLDLEASDSDESMLSFKLKYEFTGYVEDLFSKLDDESYKDVYFFIGLFRNTKQLFGWLAIPLVGIDNVTGHFLLKSGAYTANVLAPPGQSPPFNELLMKKSNIAIEFVVMLSSETSKTLFARNNYVQIKEQ